jgi:hypothetical protein
MCISLVAINSALFWSSDIHSLLQNKGYYSKKKNLFHGFMAHILAIRCVIKYTGVIMATGIQGIEK